MSQTKLRQAYEEGNYPVMLRLLQEQPVETAETIELCFEADNDIKDDKKADLDDSFVLFKEPFTGKFHFYLDREDVMPLGLRRMYPFAYTEWLLDNFHTYLRGLRIKSPEDIHKHVFAYGLGDCSPEILLYKKDSSEIIVPLFRERPTRVDYTRFINSIRQVSSQALSVLEQNPRFKESRRFKTLKEKSE